MMFIDQQEIEKKEYYKKMLAIMGSLSRLYSESDEPYLDYRVAENIFCKSFNADNLSRDCTSADASLNGIGFGIKTFGEKRGNTMEKVAEFNAKSSFFKDFDLEGLVKEIARLRNERIETTMKIYALNQMMYHCITRTKGKMHVLETPMRLIDMASIKIIETSKTSISFKDKYEEYSFNFSKNTLFKRFIIKDTTTEIPIKILENPFDVLAGLTSIELPSVVNLAFSPIETEYLHIFLPLYSTKSSGDEKEVGKGGGLNHWNAKGRKRDLNEAYIPVPAWVHKKFPDFFPDQKTPFELILPNKQTMSAKICQQGGKALMSNPNQALGKWILRDILSIPQGELVTYKKLEDIGLDTVVIYKLSDNKYKIDFAKIGSYDEFKEESIT